MVSKDAWDNCNRNLKNSGKPVAEGEKTSAADGSEKITDAQYEKIILDRYFAVRPPIQKGGQHANRMSSDDIRIALEDVWDFKRETITRYMFDNGYKLTDTSDGHVKWLMKEVDCT